MSRVVRVINEFTILEGKDDYIVKNNKGKHENHGHFKKLSTCYTIIKLMQKKTIPKSDYLLEAARRITTDSAYREALTIKQKKNKQRQHYFNPSKGMRR